MAGKVGTVLICVIASLAQRVLYVAEVARHGARAPIAASKWDEEYWGKEELGQLTNNGQNQHRDVGRKVAEKYRTSDLLSAEFHPNEIKIVTTDTKRTRESSLYQLMGIYPELQFDYMESGNPFVYDSEMCFSVNFTVLKNGDNAMLQGYRRDNCPRQKININRIVRTAQFVEKEQEVLKAFNELQPLINLTNFKDISNFVSNVKCDLAEGVSVPSQILSRFSELLREEQFYRFSIPFSDSSSLHLATSAFFHTLLSELSAAVHGSSLRFSLFSAHEMTVGSLLLALGIPLDAIPDFAATLFFEMTESAEIRVYYEDEQQELPFCPSPCSFHQFYSYISAQIVEDVPAACAVEGWEQFVLPLQYS